MRDELTRLRAMLGRRTSGTGVDAIIRTLVDALLPGDPAERRHQLTLYELYVQAGRGTGPLRELARAWNDGCVSMTAELLADRGHVLGDLDVRLLVSLSDGLMLELLVEERGDARERAVAVLTRALTALDDRIPDDRIPDD